MLAKRIIPCLDVKNGKVVKGVKFQNHEAVGDIIELAKYYSQTGADELVFYDITARIENRLVDKTWISQVSECLNIPFCVAGGISSVKEAEIILNAGADKISINSPAIENPNLINQLVSEFGSQCIVVGIDSFKINNNYRVCQYTGAPDKMRITNKNTLNWACEVQERGAGEIVLNSMNQDGVKQGYAISELKKLRSVLKIPLISSGGAGKMDDFLSVFKEAKVEGALAASVFHRCEININILKQYLAENNIIVRYGIDEFCSN